MNWCELEPDFDIKGDIFWGLVEMSETVFGQKTFFYSSALFKLHPSTEVSSYSMNQNI